MFLILSFLLSFSQQPSGWEIFEDTRFTIKWVDELGADVELPVFSKSIRSLEGSEVSLTGHYLPFELEGNRIFISRMPYASCFFCGSGVGQESVAEVVFKKTAPILKVDQLVKVKGTLKLNKDDFDHLVFIIEDAEII